MAGIVLNERENDVRTLKSLAVLHGILISLMCPLYATEVPGMLFHVWINGMSHCST